MSLVRNGLYAGVNSGISLLKSAIHFFYPAPTPPLEKKSDGFVLVKDPNIDLASSYVVTEKDKSGTITFISSDECKHHKRPHFFPDALDSVRDANKILRLKQRKKQLADYLADPKKYFSPGQLTHYEGRIQRLDLSDERTLKIVLQCLMQGTYKINTKSEEYVRFQHKRTVALGNIILAKLDEIPIVTPTVAHSPRLT